MSQKVEVLLKEYPWIASLHPLVTVAHSFFVQRLDTTRVASKDFGQNYGPDPDPENISCFENYGWFVDAKGKTLQQIHPEKSWYLSLVSSWSAFACCVWSGYYSRLVSIKSAATSLKEPEKVAFILSLDRGMWEKGDVVIRLYKMPPGKSFPDLLRDEQVESKRREEREFQLAYEEIEK